MVNDNNTSIELSLEEIKKLVIRVFSNNGCNINNSNALASTITAAERDGASSHGLFRIPGYIASLVSKKVNGKSNPMVKNKTNIILECDADNGFAPLALEKSLPALVNAAKNNGISTLSIKNCYHFAALWPETEFLAKNGLVGIACTAYKPSVAPAGSKEPFFGTNPISMAWPRENHNPVVFDMATATMAKGEVMIAARDGHELPEGVGLDSKGNITKDPKEILKGVLLPFGGHKGSAISLMVELFAAGLTGDYFSYEAELSDNNDGGPPKGGEFLLAMNPDIIADNNWKIHCENFFSKIKTLDGVRLPGERRHKIRNQTNATRNVNKELYNKINELC